MKTQGFMAFDYEACNYGSFTVNYKSGRREIGKRKEGTKMKRDKKRERGEKEDRVRRRKRKK